MNSKWTRIVVVLALVFSAFLTFELRKSGAPTDTLQPNASDVVERSIDSAPLESAREAENVDVAESAEFVALRVADIISDSPIVGADVELTQAERSHDHTTNSAGVAVIPRSSVVDADVIARADGYFPGGLLPSATRDAVLPRDAPLDVKLHPAGVLVVHVVDEDSRPIPLVHINLRLDGLRPGDLGITFWPYFAAAYRHTLQIVSERYRLSWTNYEGLLELGALPCDVPLLVEADEQVPKTSPLRVTIPSSQKRVEVTIRASTAAVLSGTLQWDDGTFAGDVKVRNLGAAATGSPGQPAVSNEYGRFMFRGLRYGENAIRIVLPGEHPRPVLIEKAETDLGTIVLPRPVEVRGKVHSKCTEVDLPVGPIQLNVRANGATVAQCSVAPTGAFKLQLPRGAYTFEFLRAQKPFHSLAVDVPCDDLDIDADQFLGRLTITDAANRLEPDFSIRLNERPRSSSGEIYTDYKAVPAGAVRVSGSNLEVWLVHPGTFEALLNRGTPADWRTLGDVIIAPGQVTTISASALQGRGSIRGVVRDSSGHPQSLVPLQATLEGLYGRDPGYPRMSATSDQRGAFVFTDLSPGSWIVFPKSLGAHAAASVRVDVRDGVESSASIVVESMGSIVGTVTRNGVPIESAQLVIRPNGERYTSNASTECFTDRDGRFRCDGIAPGEYLVNSYAQRGQSEGRRGRVIRVRPSAEARLDVDLGCEERSLTFSWHGTPIADIYEAEAFSIDGFRRLKIGYGKPPCARACLDAGTWLVRVDRARDAGVPELRGTGGSALGLVEISDAAHDDAIPVRLGEGSVLVHVAPNSGVSVLPTAELVSVGGIAPGFGPGVNPRIAYEDLANGERRFLYLPKSSVITLRGFAANGQSIEKRVETHDEGELKIEWRLE